MTTSVSRSTFPLAMSAALLAGLAGGAPALGLPVTDVGVLPGDLAVGPAAHAQQEHAIARGVRADGSDQYLVAWRDLRAHQVGGSSQQTQDDIYGIRLDASGQPIDARPFVISAAFGGQRMPRVAWNGSSWLVLFVSQDPTQFYFADQLRAVRVSGEGQVLDATPITLPPTQFEPSTVGLQLAGANGSWLITRCVYHDNGYGTYLAGQRIGQNGQLLDASPVMLMDWIYGQTKTLVSNGEYLVVGPDWYDSAITKARRISPTLQPLASAFTIPSANIAASGSEYYVTWIRNYVDLVGSRMTTAGTLLSPTGTLLVPNISQYVQTTMANDGSQWWIEWNAANVLNTLRVNTAGTPIDPLGGIQTTLDIQGNITTAYDVQLLPRTGGGVHAFWYDMRASLGSDANVFTLPFSAANTAGQDRVVSTSTANHRSPDLALGPAGQVAMVYTSEFANQDRVLLHVLSASGAPVTSQPIEVAAASNIGKASIAWNGSMYMVTWDQGASGQSTIGIKSRRLTATGQFIDAMPVDVMPGFSPSVEALGEDFLVACGRVGTYPQNIFAYMRIIDGPTGTFQNSPTLIGGNYVNVGPRVKTDGTRWIVTYQSQWTHDSSQLDSVYNFVAPDGTFTPALNPCTTSGSSGTPDVAFSGSTYLFVWRNNSLSNANNFIAGRIMNANGTFATSNFTIAEATGRQLNPVVSWDGASFVVAWEDQRNQGAFYDQTTDIYAARVSQTGTVLDPVAFPVRVGPGGDATPATLSNEGTTYVGFVRMINDASFDSYRAAVSLLGTVPSNCNDIDFNNDGIEQDPTDIEAFLSVYSGGPCVPASGTCDGLDFNNDGIEQDPTDIEAFLSVYSGGPCL